jgi:ABC-type lipoprotein release transport system permease subunit
VEEVMPKALAEDLGIQVGDRVTAAFESTTVRLER